MPHIQRCNLIENNLTGQGCSATQQMELGQGAQPESSARLFTKSSKLTFMFTVEPAKLVIGESEYPRSPPLVELCCLKCAL